MPADREQSPVHEPGDDDGAVYAALDHNELATTLRRLAGLGDPSGLPVAIETSSGLVVERLLAAGHPVVPTTDEPEEIAGGPEYQDDGHRSCRRTGARPRSTSRG